VEIVDVAVGDISYKAAVYVTNDEHQISLIPNFTEHETSAQLIDSTGCSFLVNTSYYSTDYEPLGYFETGGEVYRDYVQSSLLDGVVTLNTLDVPRITRLVPRDELIWGVQSGPVVYENGSPATLRMVRDENARRVLAAVTGDNELVFIAFYNSESVYVGPQMGELPKLIDQINEKAGLNIADAVNLDGGAASAFVEAGGFSLPEASVTGSFFCVR
jgi:exopolysaccharide biosynthesis protein